jgi:hypothetical protein
MRIGTRVRAVVDIEYVLDGSIERDDAELAIVKAGTLGYVGQSGEGQCVVSFDDGTDNGFELDVLLNEIEVVQRDPQP